MERQNFRDIDQNSIIDIDENNPSSETYPRPDYFRPVFFLAVSQKDTVSNYMCDIMF